MIVKYISNLYIVNRDRDLEMNFVIKKFLILKSIKIYYSIIYFLVRKISTLLIPPSLEGL